MARRGVLIFIITLSLIDAVIIGVLIGATSRSPAIGVLVGAASAGATWGIVVGIGTAIARLGTWGVLWQRYPGAPEGTSSPGARIVCLGLGHPWWQINNGIVARADDAHLHLRLAIPTVGDDRPLAIPWEAVRSIEPAAFGRVRLDVEGIRLWVPRVLVKNELALREAMGASEADVCGPQAPDTEGAG